jgi:UTP--glucose-1-phosphate uridylyltransferase
MQINKAIIPAAGFGTRFLPFTKAVPKELIPVVDKPTIQYVVEEAVAAGIEEILIIVSTGKQAIQDHFNPAFDLEQRLEQSGKTAELEALKKISSLARIHYVYQQELLGLGHAVLQAQTFIGNEPFAILLGDTVTTSDTIPVTKQLCDAYGKVNAPVVALETVPEEKVSRYGVVGGIEEQPGLYRVNEFVEKPSPEEAPSNLVVASRYVFTPEIFTYLEKTPRGKGGEIQITDAMKMMLADYPMYGWRINGRRHDIGNKLEFVKSTIEFALQRDDLRDDIQTFIKDLIGE